MNKPRHLIRFKCPQCDKLKPRPGRCPHCGKLPMGRELHEEDSHLHLSSKPKEKQLA